MSTRRGGDSRRRGSARPKFRTTHGAARSLCATRTGGGWRSRKPRRDGFLYALVPPTVGRRIAPHMSTDPLHTDGAALIKDDPWLESYSPRLRERHEYLKGLLRKVQGD